MQWPHSYPNTNGTVISCISGSLEELAKVEEQVPKHPRKICIYTSIILHLNPSFSNIVSPCQWLVFFQASVLMRRSLNWRSLRKVVKERKQVKDLSDRGEFRQVIRSEKNSGCLSSVEK